MANASSLLYIYYDYELIINFYHIPLPNTRNICEIMTRYELYVDLARGFFLISLRSPSFRECRRKKNFFFPRRKTDEVIYGWRVLFRVMWKCRTHFLHYFIKESNGNRQQKRNLLGRWVNEKQINVCAYYKLCVLFFKTL